MLQVLYEANLSIIFVLKVLLLFSIAQPLMILLASLQINFMVDPSVVLMAKFLSMLLV